MKKLKTTFLFLPLVIFLQAQYNIEIIDPSITPVVKLDSLTGLQLDTTVVNLNLNFKIKNVHEADYAVIRFESLPNNGHIKTVNANFTNTGGISFLSYNGITHPVVHYTATCEICLTIAEENSYDLITIYVVGLSGNESNRIYFNK